MWNVVLVLGIIVGFFGMIVGFFGWGYIEVIDCYGEVGDWVI